MSYNSIDTLSAIRLVPLIQFDWAGNTTRYARYDDDVVISGNTYSSVPTLEFKWDPRQGSPKDSAVYATSTAISPISLLITNVINPTVTVTLAEVDPRDVSTYRLLFKGTVTETKSNYQGKSGLVRTKISGWRNRLNISLGFQANTSCSFTFGDQNCGKNAVALRETAVASAIAADVITLTSYTTHPVGYFYSGYATFNQLSIRIRDQLAANKIVLQQVPPASWNGATITLTPGCDKKPVTCDTRWNNIDRFHGIGKAIPDHYPVIESGP